MSGGGLETELARRSALRALALGALLPLTALGAPLSAAPAERTVTIPVGVFRLERELTQELGSGVAIAVVRHWRIDFAGQPGGMVVAGQQVFAEVAAPASLAGLAAIERSRSASDVFPLALDRAGLIREVARAPGGATLVKALETGRQLIRSLPLPTQERADANAYLMQLSAIGASAVSRLPSDLFFPAPGEDISTHNLALTGGQRGEVVVRAIARARTDTGLLVSSERRVTTRLETSERSTIERWTLNSI